MKNSSSQCSFWILLVLAPIGLATVWDWYRHGLDWVMPLLLLVAACAAFAFARRPASSDERMQVLERLVQEIAAGKVSGRITNIGPKDATGQLCWHVNNMLDQLEACFREQAAVWRMASMGSFFRRAQPVGLHGVFRQALADTNSSLAVLERDAELAAEHRKATERAQEEIGQLIAAASRGDFSMRIDKAGKEGFFLKLAHDMNALSTTTEQGLQEVAHVLRAVAQGDLTQRVEAQYEGIFGELKDDTNATLDCLRQIVGRIQSGTDAISAASKSIATWNQDLSGRTDEQASQLVQTASSMEQLNATVKQNADGARQANELAQASNAIASRGGETVRGVASTMGEIQDSSRKIANIIGVID
ncbi:MAG TPA: hypothetical protein VED85_07635, partial [Burkholderiaceae bacterium]|nr:hypothetical protein [Burkholderiaceae bacterium]